tara:strand:- start:878 stop:1285 length:408 start_codon:yes stop_codon:yes gene_type:complete
MSNVIKFPLDRKVENIAREIQTLQHEIADRFDNLSKLFVASRELEKECGQLQVRYDDLVMEYAAAIGAENIPAGMLEYCTQVITKCDADGDISVALDEGVDEGSPQQATDKQVQEITQFMETITKFLKGKLDELQ